MKKPLILGLVAVMALVLAGQGCDLGQGMNLRTQGEASIDAASTPEAAVDAAVDAIIDDAEAAAEAEGDASAEIEAVGDVDANLDAYSNTEYEIK